MKAAVFSLLPVKENSTVASSKIAKFVGDTLGLPVIWGPEISKETWDVLLIVNGSTLYCNCLPEIAEAVSKAGKVVWIQNDYTLPPPAPVSNAESPFRKAFRDRKLVPDFWTTCPKNLVTPGSRYINWNCLTFQPDAKLADLETQRVFYYGAFRPNRELAFRKYFGIWGHVDVSSTSKKFLDLPNCTLRGAMTRDNFYPTLAQYSVGLYLQDKKSGQDYHSPANRFYEMLSVGLPMAFSRDCIKPFKTYGIDVAPYIVESEGEAQMFLLNRFGIAQEQAFWVRDFRSELTTAVKEAYESSRA
jgi:hypothetical protein